MSMGWGWARWSTSKDRLSQHIFLIPKLSVNRITLQSQKALRELLLVHPFFEDQMSNGQTKNRLENIALKRSQVYHNSLTSFESHSFEVSKLP